MKDNLFAFLIAVIIVLLLMFAVAITSLIHMTFGTWGVIFAFLVLLTICIKI